MNLDTNPFNNVIQLEEITHFQKPHQQPPKSILATAHKYRSQDDEEQFPPTFGTNKGKKVSYSPSLKDDSSSSQDKSFSVVSSKTKEQTNTDNLKDLQPHPSKRFGFPVFEDSEEDDSNSDTEFRRDFTQLPTSGRGNHDGQYLSQGGSQDSNLDRSGGVPFDVGISDENLFPLPNDIEVTRFDVIFALIVFFIHVGELVTDLTLTVWHYKDGQMWACGLTVLLITTGAISMLHQFGFVQPDQLDRTFRKGKRMRILVNCFPLATTSFVSLEGAISASKAITDGMQSQQYFRISELSRCLSRVQSFFQSAPQSALQLVILMENLNTTSPDKVWFTFANVIFSLAVMTNANLPSKTDSALNENPSRAAYLPVTRMFVGLRMFSSLGSRCMAVSYLMVGCRCIMDHIDLYPYNKNASNYTLENSHYFYEELSSSSAASSTFTGVCLLFIPRVIFTVTDYMSMKRNRVRNMEHYRDQPELGISSSHPINRIPIGNIFVGYLSTIFFHVGDPMWLYWFLWCEAGIFVIFGNVASFTYSCLDNWVSGIYTTIFVATFLIIPCLIPAAKAAVHRRKVEQVRRILQVQVVEDQTIRAPEYFSSNGNHNDINGREINKNNMPL